MRETLNFIGYIYKYVGRYPIQIISCIFFCRNGMCFYNFTILSFKNMYRDKIPSYLRRIGLIY